MKRFYLLYDFRSAVFGLAPVDVEAFDEVVVLIDMCATLLSRSR